MTSNEDALSSISKNIRGGRIPFGPGGCQATEEGKKCGETQTLQIVREFKDLYEKKMEQIDAEAGGDYIQAKMNLQQEWIRDLTEQNEMLVRAVEELENEAAQRVVMLEERLKRSSAQASEVMGSYGELSVNLLEDFQKLEQYQNDMNNLIELIKRAKYEGGWNTDGLHFYNIKISDVLEGKYMPLAEVDSTSDETDDSQSESRTSSCTCDKAESGCKQRDAKIKELEEQLKKLQDGHDDEITAFSRKAAKDRTALKKSMLDMREALTAEVAQKHDTILSLRRDIHLLEEQCRKADQQTHFKDDIIKELRKEIKQLKLQENGDELSKLKKRIADLEEERSAMLKSVMDANEKLKDLDERAAIYLTERDDYKRKHINSLDLIQKLKNENMRSQERLETLQEEKRNSIDSLQTDMNLFVARILDVTLRSLFPIVSNSFQL